MAARFGNVIYWLGCIIASLAAVVGIVMFVFWFQEPGHAEMQLSPTQLAGLKEFQRSWALIGVGTSIASYLVGRAARHVLAGR